MDIPEDLVAADPAPRARRAGELLAEYQDVVNELSRIRREALNELVADGYTNAQLADLLSTSRSRISQLMTVGPKPERALLATGSVTVAIGGKAEGGKATAPRAVLSQESHQAFEILRDLCAQYKLTAQADVVPPPGMVNLARPNLVVIGSPRLLPLVGQVLEADRNLGWEHGARGWYLRDLAAGEDYRSPSDDGTPCDYAYLGRLPRTDSKGSFLYLAGVHAMGTLGAARYLADNVEDIYREVKTRRWSTLVATRYDADTREIESTERLTPIYTA